jgi:hypothetical protein
MASFRNTLAIHLPGLSVKDYELLNNLDVVPLARAQGAAADRPGGRRGGGGDISGGHLGNFVRECLERTLGYADADAFVALKVRR